VVKDGGGLVTVALTCAVGVGPTLSSATLTWSANQPITVTIDFSVCSLTVSGASSGNGTVSGTAVTVGSGSWPGTLLLGGARLAGGQSPPNWAAGSTLPGSLSSVTDDAVTAVTDPLLYWAPFVWTSQNAAGAMQDNNVKASSTHVRTTHRGSYLKIAVTADIASGPLTLNYTPGRLAGAGADSIQVFAALDGTTSTNATVTSASGGSFTLATTLTAGAHSILFWVENLVTSTDRWNTPTCAFEVTSIKLPPGVKLAQPAVFARRMLVYGDSITDGGQSYWPAHVGAALRCEVGAVAFGGQGYEEAVPANNVPDFEDSWDDYDATQSRLVSGRLSPVPDYVIVEHGHNGTPGASLTAAISRVLAAISAAAPTARLVQCIPFLGTNRSSVLAATKPSNCVVVDIDSAKYLANLVWYTSDLVHPNSGGHGLVAAELIAKLRDAYGSFGTFAGRRL
jgi:lysophospholipase L1-like esterase